MTNLLGYPELYSTGYRVTRGLSLPACLGFANDDYMAGEHATKAVRDDMAVKEKGPPSKDGPDRKKELRTTLTPTENFFMLLMIASQVASFHMLFLYHDNFDSLRQRLCILATLHAVWAARNFVTGNKLERGMLTYGVVATAVGLNRSDVAILGFILVWSSYLFVLSVIYAWPATKLAYVHKKTVVWAMVFKGYVYSNLILWLLIGGLLIKQLL